MTTATLPQKRIERQSDGEGGSEFDAWYGDYYLGTWPTHHQAEQELNAYVYRTLKKQQQEEE